MPSRILLDQNAPLGLRRSLSPHEVVAAGQMGWFECQPWMGSERQLPLPQILFVGCAASKRRRLIELKMPSNVKQDILN